MRKFQVLFLMLVAALCTTAQTLQDAQREIDNENYFRAKQILFKLMQDPAANKTEVKYYLGNAYLKAEDVDSAKVFYKMVWNPETKTATGYLANGRLALLSGNTYEAKTNFDRAVQTSKAKSATVYFEIGDAYFLPSVVNVNEAIRNFEEAYKLDNKNTATMLELGDAYLKLVGDNTAGGKAMNKYESAAALNPKLAMAQQKIGRLALSGRIYDQAIEAYTKSIQLDPTCANCYRELGETYFFMKQYDKVGSNFAKYIELSPGDCEARTKYIGFLYDKVKDFAKASDEAKKALNSDLSCPNAYIYYRIIGYTGFELKSYKDGYEAMTKFWQEANKKVRPMDYVYSARLASQMNDTAAAIVYFADALKADSSADMLSEYAKTLFIAKRYAEAITAYNNKIAKYGSSSLDIFYLGRANYSTKDFVTADTLFAQFISRNITSPDGYWWRALTNLNLASDANKFPAVPYYLKFVEVTSADPSKAKKRLIDAYSYLGAFQMESKDIAKAKEYFGKALELDPENKDVIEIMKSL